MMFSLLIWSLSALGFFALASSMSKHQKQIFGHELDAAKTRTAAACGWTIVIHLRTGAADYGARIEVNGVGVTFHPAGFTHGPHPKAFAAGQAYAKKFTDEVAVMLDTRDALNVGSLCEGIENTRYVSSWQRPDAAAGK